MDIEASGRNSDGLLSEGAKKNAESVIEKLFGNRAQTGDVCFVMEENGEKKLIPAHKHILAMGSPLFYEMFFDLNKRSIDGEIPTKSVIVSPQTFDAFISLFYGKWESITEETLDLHSANRLVTDLERTIWTIHRQSSSTDK